MDNLLDLAKQVSVRLHFGQLDKVGEPYFNHVLRVAESEVLVDDIDRIIAYLHDVVEDTHYTIDSVKLYFGEEIATCVDNVTKRDNETVEEYFIRVNSNVRSQRVKYADSMDNFSRSKEGLDDKTIKRLEKKYTKYLSLNEFKG